VTTSTLAKTSSKKTSPATTAPPRTVTVVHDEVIKEQPIVVTVHQATTTTSAAVHSSEAATPTTTAAPTTTVPKTTTTTTAKVQLTYLVPTKAQLVAPSADYWGVAINGVPQGVSQLNALDAEVGQAPSELEWFQGWDEPYPSQAVETSWQRGALPVITWETKPTFDLTPATSDPLYSLSYILSGKFDSYIQAYAQAIVAQGLPVVIRFDQEMNGTWYPWSEGLNDNASGSYVAAWQHIWNIFQAAGANNYAIWLWAPNRVNNLPKATPPLSHFYPGDQYVDWVGVDGYYRYASDQPTFADTFGETLTQLSALTSKPVFIAETGAIETNPTTGASNTANKAAWTTSLFAGLQANPQIIGFSWFDNVASTSSDGSPLINDWRLDSDPQTLLAFKTGLQSGQFSAGLIPAAGQPLPTLKESSVPSAKADAATTTTTAVTTTTTPVVPSPTTTAAATTSSSHHHHHHGNG
jgi:hypothetical protein